MFDQVKDLYLDGLLAHIERGFSEAEFVAAFGILSVKAATLPDDVARAHLRLLVETFCSRVDVSALLDERGSLVVTFKHDIFT